MSGELTVSAEGGDLVIRISAETLAFATTSLRPDLTAIPTHAAGITVMPIHTMGNENGRDRNSEPPERPV